VPDAYRQAIEEATTQRTEEATRTGGSVMPTPIDAPVSRLQLPEEGHALEDPLERWRRIQEERQKQIEQQKVDLAAPLNPNADAIEALANVMVGQMEGILNTKKPLAPIVKDVTESNFLEEKREAEAQKKAEQIADASVNREDSIVNILIPAGTIEYAQMILEANSDIKDGPVLAHLVSGPLAGSKLLGSFDVEEEYLVLNFQLIVIDGIGHSITAIALDPDTTLPALATDVDQRYFTRVILPAAAAFVEGLGEAVSDSGSTTVVVDGGAAVQGDLPRDTREQFFKAFEKVGEKVGEVLDEDAAQTKPLIRVEAGTPMGILFVAPVTDDTMN